jgi:hypothetical protein
LQTRYAKGFSIFPRATILPGVEGREKTATMLELRRILLKRIKEIEIRIQRAK